MNEAKVELKAYIEGRQQLNEIQAKLQALGFDGPKPLVESEHYLPTRKRYLKLKQRADKSAAVIRYERLASPIPRSCSIEALDTSNLCLEYLSDIEPIGVVNKDRNSFFKRNIQVNIDRLNGENLFVEFEIAQSLRADTNIYELAEQLGVRPHQFLPYSSIHIANMMQSASQFTGLEHLNEDDLGGSFVVVDGPSAGGKSTILNNILASEHLNVHYAKRHTTRSPRKGDEITNDYDFVSQSKFFSNALRGNYMEFRDYEFGMSYGLPWQSVMPSLIGGKNVFALINLGSGPFLKRVAPFAKTVLLVADPAIIENRLRARGGLREDQISERVENAARAKHLAPGYDFVVDTGQTSIDEMSEFIYSLF